MVAPQESLLLVNTDVMDHDEADVYGLEVQYTFARGDNLNDPFNSRLGYVAFRIGGTLFNYATGVDPSTGNSAISYSANMIFPPNAEGRLSGVFVGNSKEYAAELPNLALAMMEVLDQKAVDIEVFRART